MDVYPEIIWSEPKKWFSAIVGDYLLAIAEKPVVGGPWSYGVICKMDGYYMSIADGFADSKTEAGLKAYSAMVDYEKRKDNGK